MRPRVTGNLAARLARRLLRRWGQQIRYRRLSLDGVPALFANSFPKSGTHLLTQVLEAFTCLGPAVNSGLPAVVTYEGRGGRERASAEILADLARFQPGDIGYGHLHARPEVMAALSQPGFAAYFILRDPRDVVVSHVHYVTEMEPDHALHAYYTRELHTFEERLTASITGLPGLDFSFPDIAARFAPYLGWLKCAPLLCLQYEALLHDRPAALQRIVRHAARRGFPLACPPEQAVERLGQAIQPSRSPTFRQGGSGGWRSKFTPQHTAIFKEIAGDLLIRLGYETGLDW
jgi:hypothetical protein